MPQWQVGTWNNSEDWRMDSLVMLVDEATGEIIGNVSGETRAGTFVAEYRGQSFGEFIDQNSAIVAVEKRHASAPLVAAPVDPFEIGRAIGKRFAQELMSAGRPGGEEDEQGPVS